MTQGVHNNKSQDVSEERCRSPFPLKDFILRRALKDRDTREMGSNDSFIKVFNISSPFSIINNERVVRSWRPHSVIGGVVFWDRILNDCNFGGRLPP
jgi:hypothetical protein